MKALIAKGIFFIIKFYLVKYKIVVYIAYVKFNLIEMKIGLKSVPIFRPVVKWSKTSVSKTEITRSNRVGVTISSFSVSSRRLNLNR